MNAVTIKDITAYTYSYLWYDSNCLGTVTPISKLGPDFSAISAGTTGTNIIATNGHYDYVYCYLLRWLDMTIQSFKWEAGIANLIVYGIPSFILGSLLTILYTIYYIKQMFIPSANDYIRVSKLNGN